MSILTVRMTPIIEKSPHCRWFITPRNRIVHYLIDGVAHSASYRCVSPAAGARRARATDLERSTWSQDPMCLSRPRMQCPDWNGANGAGGAADNASRKKKKRSGGYVQPCGMYGVEKITSHYHCQPKTLFIHWKLPGSHMQSVTKRERQLSCAELSAQRASHHDRRPSGLPTRSIDLRYFG